MDKNLSAWMLYEKIMTEKEKELMREIEQLKKKQKLHRFLISVLISSQSISRL